MPSPSSLDNMIESVLKRIAKKKDLGNNIKNGSPVSKYAQKGQLRARIIFCNAGFKGYVERKGRSLQRHKRVYAILFDQNLNEIVRRLYWLFKTEKAPPLS
ncbi:hypothetical protein M0657_011925 [Pyricularia oryzae]|nr:hypothetical protein M0657_011925 [Pyricularia oryzae]KAI7914298.1 hypothetical protein M9X92_009084 [Pyricularia oryzae]